MEQGGELAAKILSDKVFLDEVKSAKTREDCMLVVWKCKYIYTHTYIYIYIYIYIIYIYIYIYK